MTCNPTHELSGLSPVNLSPTKRVGAGSGLVGTVDRVPEQRRRFVAADSDEHERLAALYLSDYLISQARALETESFQEQP